MKKTLTMMHKVLFSLLLLATTSKAQVIDNISTLKNINSDRYLRLHYDNDYFTATDIYYTQGISLEAVFPALKANPLNILLLKPKQNAFKYGLRFDHYGYTPTSIGSNSILYGDRPFCGNLSFSSFIMALDSVKNARLSSTFTLGVMGSKAGGREMQVRIHEWLKNVIPLGWENQIANDVIADYHVNYEKQLAQYRSIFLLNSYSEIRVGTHTDKIKSGFNFMLGHLNNPYQSNTAKHTLRYHLYGQLQTGFTVYDATLQGGLFNRKSPYTIAAKDITRLTLQGDFGIVVHFKKLYLEYCQSFITKEFETGVLHRWGGVRIGLVY